MTGFVADASIVLTWLLDDESTPETENLLVSLATGSTAEAPVLLRYEVANVLVTAHTRRKRLSHAALLSGLQDFENLQIRYDAESPRVATSRIAQIAEHHGLTVYDAAYLELALRKGHPLATLNSKMKDAASRLGISTV